MKNERGFTLVELLSVITIMGILMSIAIVGVSTIVTNSRRDVFATNAIKFIDSAKEEVVNGIYKIDDLDTTYYIHIANLVDDPFDLGNSGFGDWDEAYVAIAKDKKSNYYFYFSGFDKAKWMIRFSERDSISRRVVVTSDKDISMQFRPIGSRSKIVVINKDGAIDNSHTPFIDLSYNEAKKCFSWQNTSATSARLTYYNPDCGTDVTIPNQIEDVTITEIYQYTFNSMGITSVKIPDSVTKIGSRAFAYNKLTTVEIPSSVKTIESEAFLRNYTISSLSLSSNLNTIGSRAFQYNALTQSVSELVPNEKTTVGSCAFCNNKCTSSAFMYTTNSDGTYSVKGYNGDLSEFSGNNFVIPSEYNGKAVTAIASGAFERMSLSGWNVVIPSSVKTIGSNAFAFDGIASVNLNEGITKIGSSAFYSNSLSYLKIPSTVTSIGELAFNINRVTSGDIWIYERTTSGINYKKLIGYSGANRTNLVVPTLTNGVTLETIGSSTLRYLSLNGTLKLPSKIKFEGSLAFVLNNLTSVDNGDGNPTEGFIYGRNSDGSINYSYLYQYARYNRSNVVIPSTIKTIGPYAFYYSYTHSVTIPEGVTSIGSNAFNLCKLSTITIPSTVTSIGSNAFYKQMSWTGINSDLKTIVNKTDRSFDWKSITGGPSTATFKTGVVENWYGDITVTS